MCGLGQSLELPSPVLSGPGGAPMFKGATPYPGGAATCRTPRNGGLCPGIHHGSYSPGNLGGGPQTGRDGQCTGLLASETKSIRLDIAGFQTRVLGLEQQVITVESQVASSQDRDQELLFLRSKMMDLEDRSRRDNVRFLGFSENIEGEDIHSFLLETMPKITGITFDPPLEFQRAHRLGPRRPDTANRPRPIIACLLRHAQPANLYREHACKVPAKWTER
ncbi:hypothetical protein NDU88_005919 [Pleurodeles waltl]|uniref:Uncharacterized protein n=1 Tax=Pleurodeles waltl TaxID=8319 RepID=A0AAV7RN57_PLEWA|nr:hypothetical protein NDU88_005919 [Pleurodeles waltl]